MRSPCANKGAILAAASHAGSPVVVIGGGLTGRATALHLKRPYLLIERYPTLGGLARTEERDGFFFDATGHWLHLRDPGIERLVRGLSHLGHHRERASRGI